MSGQVQYVQFGKYLLLDRIAVGGMAEVYRAKFFGAERFEKILAIKKLLPNIAEDEEFVEMFINEAKLASQLTHSNICQIYDLGKIDGNLFIAMEYVWGKDLLQIINSFRRKKEFMPPPMAAYIATRICEGIDYAYHKRGPQGMPLKIIHRDVSPQNILISYDGEVKIIDFGIAKATLHHSETQAGLLKGKFSYMSPEQVQGLPIDHRSDIFAIGTVLFEMLTSMSLFRGENDFITLEKVRKAEVPKLTDVNPRVPRSLEKIVLKALAADPKDRWQRAADFQDALHRFLITSPPIFTAKKLSDWMRITFREDIDNEKIKMAEYAKIGPEVLKKSLPPSVPPPRPQKERGATPQAQKRTLLGYGPPPLPHDSQGIPVQTGGSITVPRPAGENLPIPPVVTEKKVPPPLPQKLRLEKAPTTLPMTPGQQDSQTVPLPKQEFPQNLPPVPFPSPSVNIPSTQQIEIEKENQSPGQIPLTVPESTNPPLEISTAINNDSKGVLPEKPVTPPPVISPPEAIQEEKQKIVAIPKQDGSGITTTTLKAGRGVEFEEDEEPTRALDEEAAPLLDDAIKIDTSTLKDTGEPVLAEPRPRRKETLASTGQATPQGGVPYPGIPPEMLSAYPHGTITIGPDGKPIFIPFYPPKRGILSPAMKWVLVATMAMMLIIIGGLVVYILISQTRQNEKEAKSEYSSLKMNKNEGAVLLRIFPSTANVKVNGKNIPREKISEPIIVPAEIPIEVEIWQDGYKKEKFPLLVPSGGTITKEIALHELRGRVTVNSVPDKAEVYIGGQLKGESPVTIDDFPINERITVTVKKKDYESWSEIVELNEEKTERTLVAILQKGGKKQKDVIASISMEPQQVDKNQKKISKEKTGKKPEKETSSPAPVSDKGKGQATGKGEGYLIALTKPWAKVLIDGKDTGRKTPIVPTNPIKLAPGSYKVTFVLPSGESYNFNIKIKAGEQFKIIKNFEQ